VSFKDLTFICIVILGPSWGVAYLTEKIIYVVPMLAVCTFVCAQMFQNRSKRLEEDTAKKGKKGGKKDDNDYPEFAHGKDGDH